MKLRAWFVHIGIPCRLSQFLNTLHSCDLYRNGGLVYKPRCGVFSGGIIIIMGSF